MVTTAQQSALRERISADLPTAQQVRRDLHAYPELMFEERRTSEVIQRELSAAGVEFVAGLAKGTGVLAHIPATQPGGATIGLRADIDALPIKEATGLPHASTHEGVMHACGHDGHTAILLSVARVLSKMGERANDVTLLFQPGEEGGGGGDLMVKEGALDGSRLGRSVDHLYGLHGWPMMERDVLATKPGPLLASCDEFWITVEGQGGHAAMPHLTADTHVAAAQLGVALPPAVSPNATPGGGPVLSVTPPSLVNI